MCILWCNPVLITLNTPFQRLIKQSDFTAQTWTFFLIISIAKRNENDSVFFLLFFFPLFEFCSHCWANGDLCFGLHFGYRLWNCSFSRYLVRAMCNHGTRTMLIQRFDSFYPVMMNRISLREIQIIVCQRRQVQVNLTFLFNKLLI